MAGGTTVVDAALAYSPSSSVSSSSPSPVAPLDAPPVGKGRAKAPAKPTLESDPVKRARRTAIERRSRQQRQARVKLLQDEVATLTKILENLTLPQRLHEDARSLLDDFGLVPAHKPPPKVLLAKMDSLAKEMRALEREHRQMQRKLYEHQNAAAVIRDLVLQPAADDWGMNVKRWDAISRQHYAPLLPDECERIIQDCMKTITRFSLSEDFVSSGLSLNGWIDRTRYEQSSSTFEFSFSKQLPGVDPAKQFLKYWSVFWNEPEYRRVMLGLSARYHMHVLQRVSDDVVIMRQDIKYPRLDTTCHHICVVFRKRTPHGYLMCMRTIPMPQVQLATPDVIWTQNFHWNHFDEVRDRYGDLVGARSTACGSITSENAEYATLWIVEAAVTVLRIESALICPLLQP